MATIKKRGNSYLFRVYVGYDADGKQIEKTKSWRPPQGWSSSRADKEAQRLATLFEDQIRTGGLLNGKIKFSEFSDYWMEKYAAANLKPKTVARYKGLLKRINDSIGYMPLNKILPNNLLDFYESLSSEAPANATYRCSVDLCLLLKAKKITQADCARKAGISVSTLHNACTQRPVSEGAAMGISQCLSCPIASVFIPTKPEKHLSAHTVRHYHRLISDILEDAVKWQYIPYNPCGRIEAPRATPAEARYLDDQEAQHLVELLRQAPGLYRRAVLLLLLTGMRRGELLGLEWSDVEFQKKFLRITRTSQYLPDRGIYTDTPKTKSARRVVLLSDQCIDILREQFLWQQQRKKQLGPDWPESPRIITAEDGTPMHPDRLTRWFSKFVGRSNLPPICLHSLRHTYATLCIANGIPITAVSAQLGHANVAITASIYAHAIQSAQAAAADTVGGLFQNVLK